MKIKGIGGLYMTNWKEKLLDPNHMKWIPVGLTVCVLVVNVVQFGVAKFQFSQERKLLSQAEQQLESIKKEEEDMVIQEEKSVSALSLGRKVADLETEYSEIATSMALFPNEDKTVHETKNQEIRKELSQYFLDNSYQDVWFAGRAQVKYPMWDFGTKYNLSGDEKEIPVVWTCYDSNVGNTVLAYTTAVFHLDEEKFSDAVTVVTNVSDVYLNDQYIGASLLHLLQKQPVPTEESVKQAEYKVENAKESEQKSDDGSDVTSNDEDEIVILEEEPKEEGH